MTAAAGCTGWTPTVTSSRSSPFRTAAGPSRQVRSRGQAPQRLLQARSIGASERRQSQAGVQVQAVIQDRYGHPDVLRLGELPEPVPAADEVLLRVRAVSLNGSDRENLAGRPAYARWSHGLRRPRHPVLGSDVSGVVAGVGSAVTEYAVGDELFGELAGYRGGLADLVCTRPKLLARKPDW